MRARRLTIGLGIVAIGAALPASASGFPGEGSCAGEGAFVSGNAQSLGAGFGQIVSGTAQSQNGLADVIAASHAANCEARP